MIGVGAPERFTAWASPMGPIGDGYEVQAASIGSLPSRAGCAFRELAVVRKKIVGKSEEMC